MRHRLSLILCAAFIGLAGTAFAAPKGAYMNALDQQRDPLPVDPRFKKPNITKTLPDDKKAHILYWLKKHPQASQKVDEQTEGGGGIGPVGDGKPKQKQAQRLWKPRRSDTNNSAPVGGIGAIGNNDATPATDAVLSPAPKEDAASSPAAAPSPATADEDVMTGIGTVGGIGPTGNNASP